jgi:hypothetical protein
VVNVTNEAASPFSITMNHDGRLLLADERLYDHGACQGSCRLHHAAKGGFTSSFRRL